MVELEEEEEEEVGCYTTKKEKAHMYHRSVMPCSWPFGKAIHDSLWLVYTPPIGGRIFGELSRVLLQGHELLRLGALYWLGAPNGWDTTGRSQVLGRSVGEPVHLIFIGSTRRSNLHPQIQIEIRMGRRIVHISLPQPAIIGLLKMKKSNHHIQLNVCEPENKLN